MNKATILRSLRLIGYAALTLTLCSTASSNACPNKDKPSICGSLHRCGILAKQGDVEAQYILATKHQALYKSRNTDTDRESAFKWYQASADQEYKDAQLHLAQSYHKGTIAPRNITKAVEWYERAANHGSFIALIKLGDLYRNGTGVTKDLAKAYAFYHIAGIQREKEACVRLYFGERDALIELMKAYELSRAKKLADKYEKKYDGTASRDSGFISSIWNRLFGK